MKEKKLKYIVVIMTLAVIGLIGTQIYWISNIISVEKERFDRSVQSSLLRVTAKLEKHETAKTLIKKISPSGHNMVLFLNESHEIKPGKDSSAGERVIKVELNGSDTGNFRYIVKADSAFHISGKTSTKIITSDSTNLKWQSRIDTLKVKRAKLVQEVVTELIDVNDNKNLKDRINEKTLDKYLTEEFENAGINTDFYFGIMDSKTDSLIIRKNGSENGLLRKSDLRVLLFPDEILSRPDELIVYFPNRFGFIVKTSSGMLILSIILILIIVVVFQKTLQMLISQKKITQIKNDLINNITHEFKTPISSISLACEALNEPGLSGNPESAKRYSSIIKEENERLGMMVDTLLNTAALEKGNIHLNPERCDIHDLINEAADFYSPQVKNSGGKITVTLKAQNHFVTGDKFHLKNIFRNLIDNAVKYNDKTPEIIITTLDKENNIAIGISDNGIGIEKQNVDKIFETFFRVQSGNIQNIRGNGIGLSYAKQIIEFTGGNIKLTSKPGEGSTFEISLPASNGNDDE